MIGYETKKKERTKNINLINMIYNLRFKVNLSFFGTPPPDFFVQHVSHFLSYNIKSFIFSNFKERRKWKAYATLKHLFGISACCSLSYLKIKKIDCLVSSILDFRYSSYFCIWTHCFWLHFSLINHYVSEGLRHLFRQWKFTKFLRGGDGFSIKKFSSRFLRGESLLNFLNLKIKILITSYLKSVCNF